MSRTPRAGPSTGLTKTQQLRQARSAALVKDMERKQEEALRNQADPFKRRCRMVRPEPKKLDFTKPGMTKAMMARVKQAEKFKQEIERKQEALSCGRQPKRTPAPIGGDARMGRERIVDREPRRSIGGPKTPTSRPVTPVGRREFTAGPSHMATPKRAVTPRATTPRPLKTPEPTVSRKTNELARMMNADIVQADPIGEGPINNVVIPPGIVSDNRTTIVSIPQPAGADLERSQIGNRSIQVISDTLDEQDAMETSAVQNRLTELQQARRDFVITVANVGASSVNIEDETPPFSLIGSPTQMSPPRQITRVPDLEDKFLQPEFGTDHPDIMAARKFIQERETARRLEEEFERLATKEQGSDELQLDIPFEEELFQDKDISWEEDEGGMAIPRPSRVKAHVPPVPKQQKPYEYEPFDPEQLERFFDLQRYPPCPQCGPPPGRETLNPDLWELDDPWFKPPPEPEGPDLIEFDLISFD